MVPCKFVFNKCHKLGTLQRTYLVIQPGNQVYYCIAILFCPFKLIKNRFLKKIRPITQLFSVILEKLVGRLSISLFSHSMFLNNNSDWMMNLVGYVMKLFQKLFSGFLLFVSSFLCQLKPLEPSYAHHRLMLGIIY